MFEQGITKSAAVEAETVFISMGLKAGLKQTMLALRMKTLVC